MEVPPMSEIEIRFSAEGKPEIPWWSPEIAAIVCEICGQGGWTKYGPITPGEFLSDTKEHWGKCYLCHVRHPWCG